MIIKNPGTIIVRLLHQSARCLEKENTKRHLRISIIGAPNAGKSTLLNQLVRSEISSVSKKVHTTKRNMLGVYTKDEVQLEFYDSPGLVTSQHLSKHRLDSRMLTDPKDAVFRCDLVAVVVDASNIREQKRLNKGVLKLLHEHQDKRSILVMNKVDQVKEKRLLLDIGTRLTQGCIEGRLTFKMRDLERYSHEDIVRLNLTGHLGLDKIRKEPRAKHPHVIDLNQLYGPKEVSSEQRERLYEDPDSIGYKNFSHVFSISALKDDCVDEIRDYFISLAIPVGFWPHAPDFLTKLRTRDLVHEIVRGRVLEYVEKAVPYLVKYKFLECSYDDVGSLHVQIVVLCPDRYMRGLVVGDNGEIVARITTESRERISRVLGCDVKLHISVEVVKKSELLKDKNLY